MLKKTLLFISFQCSSCLFHLASRANVVQKLWNHCWKTQVRVELQLYLQVQHDSILFNRFLDLYWMILILTWNNGKRIGRYIMNFVFLTCVKRNQIFQREYIKKKKPFNNLIIPPINNQKNTFYTQPIPTPSLHHHHSNLSLFLYISSSSNNLNKFRIISSERTIIMTAKIQYK